MTPLPRLTAFVLATLLPIVTIAPALGAGGSVLRTALAVVVLVAVVRDHGRLRPAQALLGFTWVGLVAAMAVGSSDLGQGLVRAINWLMFMPLLFLAPHPQHWAIVTRSALTTCWVHLAAVGAQLLGVLGGTWGGLLTSGRDYDPSQRNWLTRYTGLVYNPNDLGLILALGVIVALMVASERPPRAGFAIPSAAIFTAGIILTGSRGAVLSLALGILVLLVFLPTLHRLLVISLAVVTSIALTTREGETRLVLDSITDIFIGADRSASVRQSLWSTYLSEADNLVIGDAFGATVREGAVESSAAPTNIATVDNSLLKLLLEGGWLSVTVFVALLAVIYVPLLSRRTGPHRYAAGAILAAMSMIAFRSASVDLFDINPWNAIIWLFAGLAVGLGSHARPPRASLGQSTPHDRRRAQVPAQAEARSSSPTPADVRGGSW